MSLIRVLVVDDSAFMRKMISDILNSDPNIEVVATARNGKEGLTKVEQIKPDVVTLDVEMPIMDGITTLKEIMAKSPIPVIMLSSLTKEGAEKTIESMTLGAIDFIAKPSGSISLDIKKIQSQIIDKVKSAAKLKIQQIIKQTELNNTPFRRITTFKPNQTVVAIGTSTGGPRALQQVLTTLPGNFPTPIVIVQHMPAGFTRSLAQRLNTLSQIEVKEADDGEILTKGTAYIAPGGYQFRVKQRGESLIAQITKEAPVNGHQPSVDVLFDSVADLEQYRAYAVIMTGMGSDGAKSLHNLKAKKENSFIVSESKNTAIVYGMPQAAEKTNLVDLVVDLHEISDVLINKIKA
ncbi:protein-glutamate methylesterase/protein-glutamine glutaminase [Aquibacillus kalidii]|uniref:protein-glutamate methylesterase/protein-glutamine glutaminase n=1 Tax=Aquibacillus kalidii TaxID=2762597 RepID=UPI001648305F|nr:chemotaxis response regulator protein-glutamate methylesterase [Aquibacillus kalidii]